MHQENTCKSCLESNLIILTDLCSFSVSEDNLQNESIFKISAKDRFMWFRSKFENDQNFLLLFHLSRKHMKIMFTIEFDHFH